TSPASSAPPAPASPGSRPAIRCTGSPGSSRAAPSPKPSSPASLTWRRCPPGCPSSRPPAWLPRPSWPGAGSSTAPTSRPASGCTGGVGEAVVQLARMCGATVAGTCSLASLPRARELGVDPVYDYAATSPADLADLRGAFDVVFDTNGTLPVGAAMRMLTKTGVFLDINATPAKFLHAALARRHKIFF